MLNYIPKFIRGLCFGLVVFSGGIWGGLPALADDVKIYPFITLREAYMSNLFYDASDREDDYITTPAAGIFCSSSSARLDMNLTGELKRLYFSEYDDLDTTEYNIQGVLDYYLTRRALVNIHGRFVRYGIPFEEIDGTDTTEEYAERKYLTTGLRGKYSLTENISAGLIYNYINSDFDDNQRYADYDYHHFEGQFKGGLDKCLPETTGVLNFGYGLYDFQYAEMDHYWLNIGVEKDLNAFYTLRLKGGPWYLDRDISDSQIDGIGLSADDYEENYDEWGWNGDVTLEYKGLNDTASLSLRKKLIPQRRGMGLKDETGCFFSYMRRISENLACHADISYFVDRADAGDLSLVEVDRDGFQIRPRLIYRFFRNFAVEAVYSFTAYDEKTADEDIDIHQAYVQLTYRHPVLDKTF